MKHVIPRRLAKQGVSARMDTFGIYPVNALKCQIVKGCRLHAEKMRNFHSAATRVEKIVDLTIFVCMETPAQGIAFVHKAMPESMENV